MTDEKKTNKRRDGVIQRKKGGPWSAFLDLGDQLYRQCPTCRKRHWVRDGAVAVCRKDGSPLDPPRSGRRQEWRSGFKRKIDAIAARDEARPAIRKGVHVVASTVTVGSNAESWLASMQKQVRGTTLENYRINLTAYIIPGIGDVALQTLSPTTLNMFYGDLLTGASWRKDKPLSEKSVRNIHAIISKILSDALDEGKVARNVARQAKPPKVTRKEPTIWTKDQMNTFLAYTADDRLYALWRLACRTGMRRGELAGLRWADVDLDAAELWSARTL